MPRLSPKSSKSLHEIVYLAPRLRKLLVIGEDESAVAAMENHFLALGWKVDCAFELEEAEAMLTCHAYAAVVTDLSLRGASGAAGLTIVSMVRARCPRTSIFLWPSARTPELEAETRQRGGVDGFFTRPQPLTDIAHAVCAVSEHAYA